MKEAHASAPSSLIPHPSSLSSPATRHQELMAYEPGRQEPGVAAVVEVVVIPTRPAFNETE